MIRVTIRKLKIACPYILAGLLLLFYLVMLVLAFRPKTTADYKMRYLDSGYFWTHDPEVEAGTTP